MELSPYYEGLLRECKPEKRAAARRAFESCMRREGPDGRQRSFCNSPVSIAGAAPVISDSRRDDAMLTNVIMAERHPEDPPACLDGLRGSELLAAHKPWFEQIERDAQRVKRMSEPPILSFSKRGDMDGWSRQLAQASFSQAWATATRDERELLETEARLDYGELLR